LTSCKDSKLFHRMI